jgi:hypothetical protein
MSMVTVEGDPDWALVKRDDGGSTSVSVRAGRLRLDAKAEL